MPTAAHAGEPSAASARFQQNRATLMYVLTGWSAASIAAGLPLAIASKEPFPRQMGIQLAAWGAVDGVIAMASLVSANGEAPSLKSDDAAERARASLHTTFWLNALLDVAYVATGAALFGLGRNDTVKGVGAGILVQGGFLLAFDSTGAWVMRAR